MSWKANAEHHLMGFLVCENIYDDYNKKGREKMVLYCWGKY